MKQIIGVDLGGTQLRAIRCDEQGAIQSHVAVPTPQAGPDVVIAEIVRLVEHVCGDFPHDRILGIGVGIPGPTDGHTGVVYEAPNLHEWIDIPLKARLSERLHLPIEVGNDANAAALGEWIFGSGQGTTDFVYVTVSTGIGGGVIGDGRLLLGRKGLAAEVGHMTIEANGPICTCGNRGCWEVLASGTALARRASEAMKRTPASRLHKVATAEDVTAAHVSQAAADNDALSRSLLYEEGVLIGTGLVNILHLYSPARIAVGGGVTQSFDWWREAMQVTIAARAMVPYRDVPVELAQLGQNVGVLGAAALVLAAQARLPAAR